jgi:hypothetical protein
MFGHKIGYNIKKQREFMKKNDLDDIPKKISQYVSLKDDIARTSTQNKNSFFSKNKPSAKPEYKSTLNWHTQGDDEIEKKLEELEDIEERSVPPVRKKT